MTQTYAPKYLRHDPPRGTDAEDKDITDIFAEKKKAEAQLAAAVVNEEKFSRPMPAAEEIEWEEPPQRPNGLSGPVRLVITVAAYAGAFLLGFLLAAVL